MPESEEPEQISSYYLMLEDIEDLIWYIFIVVVACFASIACWIT